jgi:predicted subunit of tRNA(5-methylaminomethyl-2-thiouridylate) methyltransferase
MSRNHRIKIIGGFAVAVRQGQFFRPRDAPLAESTVSDTLNHVAVVFRENGHNDPKRDAERNVARLLRRQLRLYKKDNPKEVQHKALPVCVFDSSFPQNPQNFVKRQAMGELAGAAHFWVMRSCEYAKVPKVEQRQMKQLSIRNIAFIRD